ncbi:unnamed protein product [Blepharisma stoltei]|uniref:Uncharacterized protein n=1 Tax=Blepharisma stoltei TaxID=1481888 RepID=A0AAU9JYM9_9CILI|nr:unnamed protein product [Blepharisma stoltei]
MANAIQNEASKLGWRWLLQVIIDHSKKLPVKLQVLDTAFIDSENDIGLWVYTDNLGYVHSKPKSQLKATEIVRSFLRNNLSKEEQVHFKNALDHKDEWLKIQYRDRKTCFSVKKDESRKVLYLSNLTKVMGQSFQTVFKDLEALQLYKSSAFSNDYFYIVYIDQSDDDFKFEMKKIIYNHNYPNRISRIDIISNLALEENIKKICNDAISYISDNYKVIHCEFLLIEDKQNKLWLAGLQNSAIYNKNSSPKNNKSVECDEMNFDSPLKHRAPSLNSSFLDLSRGSTPQFAKGHMRSYTNILPAKFLIDSSEKVFIRRRSKRQVSYANVIERVPITDFSAVIQDFQNHKSQSMKKLILPRSIWKLKHKSKTHLSMSYSQSTTSINEKNNENLPSKIKFRYFPKHIKGESKIVEAINRVFNSKAWLN